MEDLSLTFDDYQEMTDATAIYPRVYTEDQVKNMIKRFVGREVQSSAEITDSLLEQYLDEFETPFNRLVYPVLGLVGEAGEIANKLKKVARDGGGQMEAALGYDLADEDGDVLWYVARIARELKFSLGVVADDNINKLFSRKERGVLGGSGDNR